MPTVPWKLLRAEDVSPSKWFPIERRSYQLPNGKVVDDFTVTTLADVSLVVPITDPRKVVLVEQYKPGVDEVMLQFPAGRIETGYQDMTEAAQHELEEEVGIKVERDQLEYITVLSGFSTKATEKVFCYLAQHCVFNSIQDLDETELIEVVELDIEEVDQYILDGKIWCSQSISAWEVAKKKYPYVFASSV
jgi:ADP-ribose pyrophosphatase